MTGLAIIKVNSNVGLQEGADIRISEVRVHTWIIGKKNLSLWRKGDKVDCEVLDRATSEKYRIPIELENENIDAQISCLVASIPELRADNSIVFAKAQTCIEWENHSISLIQWQNSLIWQLFDNTLKISSWLPAEQDFGCYNLYRSQLTLLDPKSSENLPENPNPSRNYIRQIFRQYVPAKLRLSIYEGFTVSGIRLEQNQLQDVFLGTLSGVSIFDTSKTYNRNNWAVTVICAGQSWHGHAVIVIEGVEKGNCFLRNAHIAALKDGNTCSLSVNAPANVEIFDNKILNYSGKTETWVVERLNVEEMLRVINWEILKQQEGSPQVFFNYFGSEALVVQPNLLESETVLENGEKVTRTTHQERLVARKVTYALPNSIVFLPIPRVFDIDSLARLSLIPLISFLLFFPKMRNIQSLPLPPLHPFSNGNSIHSKLFSIFSIIAICRFRKSIEDFVDKNIVQKLKKRTTYRSIRGSDKSFSLNASNLFFYHTDELNDLPPVQRVYEVHVVPDNCISWARKKLAIAKIDLPANRYSYLFDLPSQYFVNMSKRNKTKKQEE